MASVIIIFMRNKKELMKSAKFLYLKIEKIQDPKSEIFEFYKKIIFLFSLSEPKSKTLFSFSSSSKIFFLFTC